MTIPRIKPNVSPPIAKALPTRGGRPADSKEGIASTCSSSSSRVATMRFQSTSDSNGCEPAVCSALPAGFVGMGREIVFSISGRAGFGEEISEVSNTGDGTGGGDFLKNGESASATSPGV